MTVGARSSLLGSPGHEEVDRRLEGEALSMAVLDFPCKAPVRGSREKNPLAVWKAVTAVVSCSSAVTNAPTTAQGKNRNRRMASILRETAIQLSVMFRPVQSPSPRRPD